MRLGLIVIILRPKVLHSLMGFWGGDNSVIFKVF
jgi:hypothetical protein